MTKPAKWTDLDETTLQFSRTMESELRQSHGTLFAAAFLDEFENEINKIAMQSLIAGLTNRTRR